MRLKVYQTVLDQAMVPLAYVADINKAKKVVDACYAGGLRSFEFTNRGVGAHKVFDALAEHCRNNYPDMYLGIGSVVDPGTASLYIQLGAAFIVGPTIDEDVVKVCHRRKVAWMPGCFTPSEIARAEGLGAEIVKLFPGNAVAPGFISAYRGPSPQTTIMVTGGVTSERSNLERWFGEGAAAVGMGSQLIKNDWIKAGEFGKMETLARETLELIREIRG